MPRPRFHAITFLMPILALVVYSGCTKKYPTPPTGPAPAPVLTDTPTPMSTSTETPTDTVLFTETPTPTCSSTDTETSIPTDTSTPTDSFTNTHTGTMTRTFTDTRTPTVTGTPTQTRTRTCTRTIPPHSGDFNMMGGTATMSGLYNLDCVHIGGGAVVTIAGGVTIICKCFVLDAGATITGKGMSYLEEVYPGIISGCYSSGPGTGGTGTAGMYSISLAGGGGHAGKGGDDSYYDPYNPAYSGVASGGVSFDDPVLPSGMGGHGARFTCTEGRGGGLLKLVVFDPVGNVLVPATVNGTIDMSGMPGNGVAGYHMGGGAGGTILIEASSVDGTGSLMVCGGTGGGMGYLGGHGASGFISLIENKTTFDGQIWAGYGTCVTMTGKATFTAAPASGYY